MEMPYPCRILHEDGIHKKTCGIHVSQSIPDFLAKVKGEIIKIRLRQVIPEMYVWACYILACCLSIDSPS
jgi:hypothetical protein